MTGALTLDSFAAIDDNRDANYLGHDFISPDGRPSHRKRSEVRVTVNDGCQGCGVCEATAPEVFEIQDDGSVKVLVQVVPLELEQAVRNAAHECPTEAIEISE